MAPEPRSIRFFENRYLGRRLRALLRPLLACALAAAPLAAPVFAQEQSVSPGINRHYEDADFARWQRTFESPGREVYDRRQDIVAALGLKPGMTVADIGAGTGLFTRLLSPAVGPSGTVYAQDISREFLENLERIGREERLANVKTVLGTERDARLPANTLDLAFLCDTYHHFEYPRSMLASIHRALKPGGALVVIDFEKTPGLSSAWVMGHVRADRETAIREIEAAGFRLAEDRKLLRENYFLRFVRQ
jgi:predicted methyltransferase